MKQSFVPRSVDECVLSDSVHAIAPCIKLSPRPIKVNLSAAGGIYDCASTCFFFFPKQ